MSRRIQSIASSTPAGPASPILRRIAAGERLLVAGAHSALSAKLVEEAGFDGIWASGFEISASRAVPDANVLTMAEQLEVARQIADAVRIPVFADCDNGFGNAINAIRAVQEYEKAGVAGICIEDNVFPKRCSFYAGTRRELASVEEHCGKIQASIAARRSPEFLIIARTEAFIAGWGLEEALRRGRAYADAGADLVLVHSKEKTAWELEAFSRQWDRDVPCVAVPTMYGQTEAAELQRLGYPVVIFANQALRASLRAMREALAVLRRDERANAADDRIATMEQVYQIVGVAELEENERAYSALSQHATSAVVLAAGFDEALMPLVADRPKCMLDLRGRTILERQLDVLRACGVHQLAIVRGYKKETIRVANVRTFDNDAFETTGEAASLLAAAPALEGRTLVLYGDVVFEREILEKLLRSESSISVLVDRAFDPTRVRSGKPDLVVLDDPGAELARRMTLDGHARVLGIGPGVEPSEAHGEFVGLALFDAAATEELRTLLAAAGGDESLRRASLTDLLGRLIAAGREVASIDVRGGWLDVDSFEDYRAVWARVGE